MLLNKYHFTYATIEILRIHYLVYISSDRELAEGRLSDSEHHNHPVLKKYIRGEPTSKLYIKNLAKQTTEDELRYIFGR